MEFKVLNSLATAFRMNFETFEKFMLRRNFKVIVDNKVEPLIKFSSDFAMLLQSQFYIKLVYKATLSFKLKFQVWTLQYLKNHKVAKTNKALTKTQMFFFPYWP